MATTPHLVDIEFATSQLAGNKVLLTRMLGKFCEEFRSTPNIVIDALAQGNYREAKMKVHTTKGLSGNLGLMALFECAKVLDQQIKDNSVSSQQLTAFSDIMRDTIDCISELQLTSQATTAFAPVAQTKDEPDTAKFIQCLEGNEFIDDDTLFSYINALAFSEPDKQRIKTLVEELQYTEALAMINGRAN